MAISRSSRSGLGVLAGVATALLILVCSVPAFASVGAEVRVLNTEGRALAQLRQFTDTVNIRTDPNADCFGPGTGGSGRTVSVPGPTALGIVHDAQATQRAIRPVSVTDAFGFALGICGFGGFRADQTHFWYLKVNHNESSVGGDQVTLRPGDDVIWYLIPTSSCPPPDFFCQVSDLLLKAPARARANGSITVRVFAYSRTGVPSVAAGAVVNGGAAPAATGPDGRAVVQMGGAGTRQLFATRGADIPSQFLSVCVAERLGGCPKRRGKTIAGSPQGERIRGTGGPDKIKARGGRDLIQVRGGGPDKVNCGRGRDTVIADKRDKVKRNCERVVRRGKSRRGGAGR